MSRRKSKGFVREINPDVKYGSQLVQKMINVIMNCGKKTVATSIVYEALDTLMNKFGTDKEATVNMFEKIIISVSPEVEVKSRRVGGGVYQVPTQVRTDRSRALAMRWIINAARSRSDKTMGRRLAKELLDAAEGRGGALKKRSDVHKMAEANRAFSHYAW